MKQNQNKVNETKTVENIECDPVLSQLLFWFHLWGLITVTIENLNLNNEQKFVFVWAKFDTLTTNMNCVKSVYIRSYSAQVQENTNQNSSKYGHLSRSDHLNVQLSQFGHNNSFFA